MVPAQPQSTPAGPDTPLFVGREPELARLHGFLERAVGGQGRVVFVTGEAGAGKTTLVTEFVRQAQQSHDELLFVVGNCNAQTGLSDPYLPFREVLAQLTGDVEDKLAQGALSARDAQRLRKFFQVSGQVLVEYGPMLVNTIVPGAELATRIGIFAAEKLGWVEKLSRLAATPATDVPELSQERIFEQYTAVLQALAAKQPLALWLDDLHWVDSSSAGLLFHLGRSLQRSRILVLGTYRQEDIALGRGGELHPLADVVSEFKRYWGDIEIDMDEVRVSEGRRFVDALLDSEPNRLDEGFRLAMYGHTSGHPLFTVELLRDLQERGELVLDDTAHWVATPTLNWDELPARVEGVIEKRIRRLDADLQDALTTASVEGEQFTVEVVAQVQAVAARDLVRRLSREADKQHRLVQAQGSQRMGSQRLSRYQFRHSLIQKYLYNGLDDVERAYLHEDVGNTLEQLCANQAETLEAHVEALAYHFYEAALWPKALQYARRAGEKAQAIYAPQAAIEQFTRALEAADQLGEPPAPALYRRRGQAFDTLGNFDRARADYEAAHEAARAAGDQRLTWQTLLDLGLLWASRDYDQTGDYCRQALDLARAMGDQAAVGHSLNRLGNWVMNSGRPSDALAYHQEALGVFEALDDRPGIAATLDLLAMASGQVGDAMATADYYERAIVILRELDDRQTLASSLTNLANISFSEAGGREAIELAREIGWRSGEAYALQILGLIMFAHGDPGQGMQAVERGLALAQEIDHRLWQSACHLTLGQIYLDLLAPDRARPHLEDGLSLATDVGSGFFATQATGTLASALVQQGLLEEADALLPAPPYGQILMRGFFLGKPATELALVRREPLQALQLLDAVDLPDRSTWRGVMAYLCGSFLRLRGETLAMLGRLDEAEAAMQDVVELCREHDLVASRWRAQLALGNLHRAAQRFERADSAFAEARAAVEELAAAVGDGSLREQFRRQAFALIPAPSR